MAISTDTRKSAWDVEAERGTECAMDAVDSGFASWFTLPVTEAGRGIKAMVDAGADI